MTLFMRELNHWAPFALQLLNPVVAAALQVRYRAYLVWAALELSQPIFSLVHPCATAYSWTIDRLSKIYDGVEQQIRQRVFRSHSK